MFIRIVKNDLEGKGNTHERIVECKDIKLFHRGNGVNNNGDNNVLVIKVNDFSKSSILFELTKEDMELYIMNNEGNVIDNYTFPQTPQTPITNKEKS
jgi:hypothetical protein